MQHLQNNIFWFCWGFFFPEMAHSLPKQKITVWKLRAENWRRSAVILNYMSRTCHFLKSSKKKAQAGCLRFLGIEGPLVLLRRGLCEPLHSSVLKSVRSISEIHLILSVNWLNVKKMKILAIADCAHGRSHSSCLRLSARSYVVSMIYCYWALGFVIIICSCKLQGFGVGTPHQ